MAFIYKSTTVSIKNLTDKTVHSMAALYLQHFDASSEAMFRADLAEKDDAILLFADERLVGFTTLKVFQRVWNTRHVHIVYSGDTIVSPAHWGQQQLAFAWIAHIGQIKQQAPEIPLYWFLLVKGHRTFKYLPVFGKSFFPHWSLDRSDLQSLAHLLAQERFGNIYNPETGVVEFPDSRGHLNEAIAFATPEEMTKPATQFFFQRNPSYRQGHELVCVCELELSNMKPLTARIFQRAFEEVAFA